MPPSLQLFFSYTLWLLMLPPLFALVGGQSFGWRLGAESPLVVPFSVLVLISVAYFGVLLFGFFSTVFISQWMATTYGASRDLGRHIALVSIVGQPLVIGSSAHLFPDVFFNVVVLIPAMLWSMYLLYSGVPILLDTPAERGMLLSSALLGWLLVAAVSLLGLSMMLWVSGFGPAVAV